VTVGKSPSPSDGLSAAITSSIDASVLRNSKSTSRSELTTAKRGGGLSVSLNIISETDEPTDDSMSYDSQQEQRNYVLQPFEKPGMVDHSLVTMTIKADDGDTDSTDSSFLSFDDTLSSSCSSPSSVSRLNRFWRSDLPISHNLAILFIQCVKAQGRMECRLRTRYTRNMFSTPANSISSTFKSKRQNRKRKGSEEISPDDYDGTCILAQQLKESLLPAP